MNIEGPDPKTTPAEPVEPPIFVVDTTQSSLFHRALGVGHGGQSAPPSAPQAYVFSIAITYLPLIVAASVSSIPLATISETVRLPFLYDWNIALVFLVSFPCVIVLTASDQSALHSAMQRVQLDGTLTVAVDAVSQLAQRWEQRFRIANIVGQGVGVAIGGVLAYFNYLSYAAPSTGYWIASQGRLEIVGYVFLYCIFLFYASIPLYVIRLICTSLLLRDVVSHSTLRLLPFHPDRSGGLRPVGRLGLRNQYGLTVFGLNVVSLLVISTLFLSIPSTLYGLIVAAAVAYAIVGPLVFMGPLLPFRAGMLRTKNELMGEIAQRLRVELQRLRTQLAAGSISKEDEELIDRLRKIGRVVDELPIWPFDASTLRRFLTAYVLPVLGAIAYPVGSLVVDFVTGQLNK